MSKIKLNFNKKTIIIIAVTVAVFAVLIAAVALLFFKGEFKTYDLTNKNPLYSENITNYKSAFSDNAGNILLYNEQNGFIAIKNKEGQVFLNANSKAAATDKLSAVLNVSLRDKNGSLYVMNSNDNSVKFKTFEIKNEKNSLEILYSFYKDKDDAANGFKKSGFCVQIPVVFTTENGNLKVFIDMKNVILSKGIYIETISVLPGFFSVDGAVNGEHFLVPDGSGAKVNLNYDIPEKVNISLNTYGTDVAVETFKDGALVPCYALAVGNETYSVVVTDGDALSKIICERQKEAGRGSLYSEFIITPVSKPSDKRAIKVADSYDGVVSLTFVFSKNQKNSYNTLAVVARDIFIKNGYLSPESNYDFGDLPFFINLIGSERTRSNPYTTFEDAKEILSLLNSKGVRNVSIRFSGALNGGLKGDKLSTSPVLKSLGGSEGLKELTDLAIKKRSSVWFDLNLFSGGIDLMTVNQTSKTSFYTKLYSYMGKPNVENFISDSGVMDDNISSAYNFTTNSKNVNLNLNDVSFLLFTDTNNNINRQEMLETEKRNIRSLSVNSAVSLSKPALWLMGEAAAVSEVPQKANYEGVYCVESVPLLQMIIHGSVVYGGEPLNVIGGNWESILKLIEYGAVPSFLFTYEECNNLSYGAYASQTAHYYSKVKSLKAIQNMAMTSHEKLLTGVYKITYGYNKVVYVNYNQSVITVDGLLLSPQDFIIV